MSIPENKEGVFAEVTTSKGKLIIELEYKKVPLTVCNFVGLAEGKISNSAKGSGEPYYDGISFHRVISDFMIQGGDPEGSGRGGPGYRFEDEFDSSLTHNGPGVLSMANAGPGTNGSQFFITHSAQPHLDNKHAVFGFVIDGIDVVNAIEQGDSIETVVIHRSGDEASAFSADQEMFDDLQKGLADRRKEKLAAERADTISKIKEDYPDAQETDTGLMYVVTEEGSGDKPEKGNQVTAHYTGKLLDGTKFDSSVDRGQPFNFSVGMSQVIQGWDQAFLDMKKGEKRTLILPPELGYGSQGAGGVIPPNAYLVFDVELIDFA